MFASVNQEKRISGAIEHQFPVPKHIEHAVSCLSHDLFNGPTVALLPNGDIEQFCGEWVYLEDSESLKQEAQDGDIVEEAYAGKIGDAVRDFIDTLPSEMFWDDFAEILLDKEPQAYEEDGEIIEPSWDEIIKLDRKDIVSALFGSFFAREFS